jgi:hypothetical protein
VGKYINSLAVRVSIVTATEHAPRQRAWIKGHYKQIFAVALAV